MSDIKIIRGEIFCDARGQISSVNDFRFDGIERFYVIHHSDTSVIRGWHGHRHEKKWFYCIKGAFTLAFVKIDDWESPSPNLRPEFVRLNAADSRIVCVPEGYANCIKATLADSALLVFSGKILSQAVNDSWRYDKELWVKWDEVE